MADQETPELTPEYCKTALKRLVFRPKTVDEAAFIAEQFIGMGYRYYKPEFASQLELALKGSIYLDTDKTIMVRADSVDGISCSIDGFRQFFVPAAPLSSDARLKPDDCRRRALAFYPRTSREARDILTALQAADVAPVEEFRSVAAMMTQAVVYGIFVRDGRLSFGPTPQDLQGAEICSGFDLGLRTAVALSAEQATIMAAFNEMSARMEQMSQRIARLEDAVLPKELDKGPLPRPKR